MYVIYLMSAHSMIDICYMSAHSMIDICYDNCLIMLAICYAICLIYAMLYRIIFIEVYMYINEYILSGKIY